LSDVNDEQQILRLFEDGDRALVSADVAELHRIYSDDYVQYDESGAASSRQDLIRNLQSGVIRFIAMISTERQIRILRDGIAVVHGSEVDEIVRGGELLSVRYVYLDVVEKGNGRWQIVASQLAKPPAVSPVQS
jgi:ketosteroid isomerase-like protein